MKTKSEKLLSFEFLLQGIGLLISWNSILSALDWYNANFPSKNSGFWLPLLNFIPSLIFQPLTILYGHNFTFNTRIIPSYLSTASILILTPIVVENSSEDLGFIIICSFTFVSGIINTIGQTSYFGLAGTLPNKYPSLVMFGNGLSGLLITSVRLICLGIFPQNKSGYLYSTEVYFAISGSVLILCIFAQIHMMKNSLVMECVGKTHSNEWKQIVHQPENSESINDDSEFSKENKPKINYRELFTKIWQFLFLVWLNFVITFGVLAHVALATQANGLDYPIFATLMIFTFNLFDVFGRYTPMFYILKGKTLWIAVIGRFIFWGTFILVASDDPRVDPSWLFDGTWFKFVNMALYAYTNGICCTSCMVLGPEAASEVSKDKAGYSMATALIFGIFTGQIASFAFINVGHGH